MRIRWRNFELPNRVTVDEATRTGTYGCFFAEPFERGFGTTVGNGLRRILLGSLEGTAVTHVRIQGVQPVSGRKPDLLAVERDSVHVVDAWKGPILAEDFGC